MLHHKKSQKSSHRARRVAHRPVAPTNRSSPRLFQRSRVLFDKALPLSPAPSPQTPPPSSSLFVSVGQAFQQALDNIDNSKVISAHTTSLCASFQAVDLDTFSAPTHHKPFLFPPTQSDREAFLKQLNVDNETKVFVYDDGAIVNSTRFVWQASALGVPLQNISIIRGGSEMLEELTDVGQPDVVGAQLFPVVDPTDLSFQNPVVTYNKQSDLQYRISDAEIVSLAKAWDDVYQHGKPGTPLSQALRASPPARQLDLILDTRGAAMFVNGHIPGSHSFPLTDLLTNVEMLLPKINNGIVQQVEDSAQPKVLAHDILPMDQLAAIFSSLFSRYQQAFVDAGVVSTPQPVDVIFSCQTARTATVAWVALQSVLQSEQHRKTFASLVNSARVYDNSWLTYGSDVALDVPGWDSRPKSIGQPPVTF